MTTYSVHLPAEAVPGTTAGLDRAVLTKDGFHWLALVFPLLWLLFNRLWLALLTFVALTMATVFVGRAAGLSQGVIASLDMLLGLFVAFSASDLKAWGLSRRGYRLVDVVTAPRLDEAERRFFERWLARTDQPGQGMSASAVTAPAYAQRPQPQVLGLFPDAGGAR